MSASRENSFRALAYASLGPVAAYVRRRLYPLTEADLDDVVSETLVVAWRRFDSVPEPDVAWMIGVARNVLRNQQRARRRRDSAEAKVRPSDVTASAEDVVIADDTIRRALAQLSDGDREVLLLSAWDGLSTPEIATVVGISPETAAVRLSRANTRFKEQFAAS
jgi:RNA polymerase sigma-70 factor (ECF subfamily)